MSLDEKYLADVDCETLKGVSLDKFYENAGVESEEDKVKAQLLIVGDVFIMDAYEGSLSDLEQLEGRYNLCYVEGESFDMKAMKD